MPESVTAWIRSVIVYMLVVSVLMHLLPEEKYRQYVRIFAGLLLLLIVLEPIGVWLADADLSQLLSESLQAETWDTGLDALKEAAGEAESSAVLSAYTLQLEEEVAALAQAQGYVVNGVQVSLTEDGIKQITISVSADGSDTKQTDDAAALEQKAGEGQWDALRDYICETYQIEAAAVTVEVID